MVVVAHPDDAEFGVGGTAAKWAKRGTRMVYVICTDGSKGTDDPALTADKLVPLRHAEQRAACEALGVRDIVFLDREDGMLRADFALRRDIARQIRRYKPQAIFCPDPTSRFMRGEYINHPDHLACGEATLAAVFPDARNRWMYPELLSEGLEPHKVLHVFLTASMSPNVFIDITETMDQKLRALSRHKTQIDATHKDAEEMVRGWSRLAAQGHEVEYAEAFRHFLLR